MEKLESTVGKLCIAPMMGITDRHFRFLARLISKSCTLYTEMLPASAITHGKKYYLLNYDPVEHPLIVQWAGFDEKIVLDASLIAQDLGYDEINLNIGCPSPRTNAGGFGLCLLNNAQKVSDIVSTLKAKLNLPITVKTRVGINNNDSLEFLADFTEKIVQAGCDKLILHARIGILGGMGPRKNRTVPEINYPRVYEIKKLFPNLPLIINGMINSPAECLDHLKIVDGVMLGRVLAKNLWLLANLAESVCYEQTIKKDFLLILDKYFEYAQTQVSHCKKLHIIRPLFSLFWGEPQAKQLKGYLNLACRKDVSLENIHEHLITELDKNQ